MIGNRSGISPGRGKVVVALLTCEADRKAQRRITRKKGRVAADRSHGFKWAAVYIELSPTPLLQQSCCLSYVARRVSAGQHPGNSWPGLPMASTSQSISSRSRLGRAVPCCVAAAGAAGAAGMLVWRESMTSGVQRSPTWPVRVPAWAPDDVDGPALPMRCQ